MKDNSYKRPPGMRLALEVRDNNGRVEVGIWNAPDTDARRLGAIRLALESLICVVEAEGKETGDPWIESLLLAGRAKPIEHRRTP